MRRLVWRKRVSWGFLLHSVWPTLLCETGGRSGARSCQLASDTSLRCSQERHCCRVSAADKRWRAYPLDPRTDAVALYSGCTPDKRRAWFLPGCQMTGTLPPLLDPVVVGGTPGLSCVSRIRIQVSCARVKALLYPQHIPLMKSLRIGVFSSSICLRMNVP
ncbi:hypothetical protein TNCV_1233311 [Trichonephila clavipes]|nr:hypothetical protein TNCV_1233311 [Trichonephila clavipes]